jgi:hypothetical protein
MVRREQRPSAGHPCQGVSGKVLGAGAHSNYSGVSEISTTEMFGLFHFCDFGTGDISLFFFFFLASF